MGLEFYGKAYLDLMKRLNINFYSTFSPLKAFCVERLNLTIKQKLFKVLSYYQTKRWIAHLQDVIDEYNATKHRTIQCSPNDVNKDNELFIYDLFYRQNPHTRGSIKFSPGDNVRISKYKTIFEKSYTRQWTTEIFRVKQVKNTYPVTYTLEDMNGDEILGGFYNYELKRVAFPNTYLIEEIIKEKDGKCLVRYLGEKVTKWVDKAELVD